jgi:hypothetical protein
VHGAAEQLDAVASNVTACPVTGEAGLNVKDAVGAGGTTSEVGAELADVEPPELAAVTMERMVWPTSPNARL